MNNSKEIVSAAYTTLKEYDAAIRRSQRKLKDLNEAQMLTPSGEAVVARELELAKASHKFLLASRAKFKETGVSSPQLRDVQALALEEGRTQGDTPVTAPAEVLGIDYGAEPGKLFTPEGERLLDETARLMNGYRKPTAAEPQALLARDRSREFVPSARVIRERAHAGAMRAHKFAPDDSRAQGLGYKSRQRRAEQKRRVLSLAIKPVFPAMRDSTCFLMRNSDRRILVNGQPW